MNAVYLTIVWIVCIAYIGLNLCYKDFWGRVFAVIIFFVAVVFSIVVASL